MVEPRYRWVIVAAGAVMGCVALGAMFSLPVLLRPIAASTGWSTTGVSAAMTVGFLAMAVGSAAWGFLSDRIGARWTCLVGSLLMGAGLQRRERGAIAGRIPVCFRIVGGPGDLCDLCADHGLRDRLVFDAAEPGGITGISGVWCRTADDVAVGRLACGHA